MWCDMMWHDVMTVCWLAGAHLRTKNVLSCNPLTTCNFRSCVCVVSLCAVAWRSNVRTWSDRRSANVKPCGILLQTGGDPEYAKEWTIGRDRRGIFRGLGPRHSRTSGKRQRALFGCCTVWSSRAEARQTLPRLGNTERGGDKCGHAHTWRIANSVHRFLYARIEFEPRAPRLSQLITWQWFTYSFAWQTACYSDWIFCHGVILLIYIYIYIYIYIVGFAQCRSIYG